jgi:hypothetical protein
VLFTVRCDAEPLQGAAGAPTLSVVPPTGGKDAQTFPTDNQIQGWAAYCAPKCCGGTPNSCPSWKGWGLGNPGCAQNPLQPGSKTNDSIAVSPSIKFLLAAAFAAMLAGRGVFQ